MESIGRASIIYAVLFLLFRIAGKRTLAQLSAFDFVLLLVIGEASQQALLGEDFSLVNATLVISTLVGVDILLGKLKQSSKAVERVLEEPPLVIVADGRPLTERMRMERIDEQDILHAARSAHGIERLDQIHYAVLEGTGGISIIPYQRGR